jgi:uncharacterized membrane protein YfcA
VAACAALLVAELVYVTLGFGAGLIAVGTLAMVLSEVRDAVVILLLVNTPVELYVVSNSWRQIEWRGLAQVAAAVTVGLLLGTAVLRWGAPTFLLTLLGCFLVVAGSAFLLLPQPDPRQVPGWAALPVGLSSGVLGGLFGTGGPPLIIYYQMLGTSKTVFRGTLMALFGFMTVIKIPSYWIAELITLPRLWSALAVLPAVILGAWIGNRIHLRLEERTFRRLVSVALVVLGLLLLSRN